MYFELGSDIAPMCHHGIYRHMKHFGYFLVRQALGNANHNLALAHSKLGIVVGGVGDKIFAECRLDSLPAVEKRYRRIGLFLQSIRHRQHAC